MVRRRRVRPASALESLPPLWILTQIIILQIAFYASATILLLFTTLIQGSSFSLDTTFSWRPLRSDNAAGWTLALVWLSSSLENVVAIALLIGRSKFALDFSLTIYFVHLIVTSLYSRSLPLSWLWWTVQFGSSFLTVILSTWLCQKREMQPISWVNAASSQGRHSRISVTVPDQEHEMIPLNKS